MKQAQKLLFTKRQRALRIASRQIFSFVDKAVLRLGLQLQVKIEAMTIWNKKQWMQEKIEILNMAKKSYKFAQNIGNEDHCGR